MSFVSARSVELSPLYFFLFIFAHLWTSGGRFSEINPPTWLCQDSGRVSKISICAFNLSRVALRETYTQHSKIFTCIFLNSLKLYFEVFHFFSMVIFLFFSKPKKVLRYRCYWIKIKYNLCFDWFMYNILINII